MLGFYLGGVIATAGIVFGANIADDKPIDAGCFLYALFWPVFIAMLFIKIIKERS